MKKILVTGGAGFIGFHLVKSLADEENCVVILDNFSRSKEDKEFLELISMDNVKFIKGDITDKNLIDSLDLDFDEVYHMAAINGTGNFYTRPHDVLNVGVIGMINILEKFGTNEKTKLLFASSSETYAGALKLLGDKFPIPTPENVPLVIDDPSNVRWSYGVSKIMSEVAMHSWAKVYGKKNYVIVRFHNIYGPRMGYDHVMPQFIERILKNENPFKIYGGQETRAFCYVSDAVEALKLIMAKNEVNGQVIHIGKDDEEIKIVDFAKMLFNIANVDPSIELLSAPEGCVMRRCPNINKLKNLGFSPKVNLVDGLKLSYDWYKDKFIS